VSPELSCAARGGSVASSDSTGCKRAALRANVGSCSLTSPIEAQQSPRRKAPAAPPHDRSVTQTGAGPITYLRTGEGWLYLAAVQDAYSRLIVGWSMATHMRASLVIDALKMALARRRPDTGLIHHSEQGSQYVSLAFGRAAHQAEIAVSMGSRGDAYDNAVAQTFFATLKKELVNRRTWPSRLELQSAVFEYIEAFYNRQRRHSTLNMLSPTNYEQLRLSPLGG
jgi:putative transposase